MGWGSSEGREAWVFRVWVVVFGVREVPSPKGRLGQRDAPTTRGERCQEAVK